MQYAVIFGAIINLLGNWQYLKDTLWGNTKPNRVTYVLWSVAPMIGTVAALSEGVTWAVLPVFMAGFGPFLILLASFVNKNAYWKLEFFDYLCGFFSVLALILWWTTKEASVAILFAVISDTFALIPTLKKCWLYPETETGISYASSLFNSLTSFLAIKMWNFSSVAFPVYLVISNALLVLGGYGKRILR